MSESENKVAETPKAAVIPELTLAKFRDWAAKTGKQVGDFISQYNSSIELLKRHHPVMDSTMLNNRARAMVYANMKSIILSPAVPYEWICLGLAESFDLADSMHKTCTEMWKEDPGRAASEVKEGNEVVEPRYCNTEGVHLDYRFRYKSSGKENPNYGKPLAAHNWLRNVFGVGKPVDKPNTPAASILPMIGILSDARAEPTVEIPLGVSLTTRFNPKQAEGYYLLNDSTTSKFELRKVESMPEIGSIITGVCQKFIVSLGELMSWHNLHESDPQRVCIVEADLVDLRLDVSDRSHQIILDDETLGFQDDKGNLQSGVTVWIPKFLTEYVYPIGNGSRIYVVGQTQVGPGWVGGQQRDDIKQVFMNGYGVWPIKEMLVPREADRTAYPESSF